MLPVMAAGLGSILFSISLDSDSLNTPTRNLDTSLVATPLSSGPTSKLLNVQPNQNGESLPWNNYNFKNFTIKDFCKFLEF